MTNSVATRCIDTGIDHYEHVPVPQSDIETARRYAADLSSQRNSDVQIIDAARPAKPLETYRHGELVGAK